MTTGPRVLAAFNEDGWPPDVAIADRRDRGRLAFLRELVRRARHADVVVLLGTTGFRQGYTDVLAAVAIKHFPRRPAVIMTEATWELGSAALGRLLRRPAEDFAWLARAVVRAFDGPHVTYTVLATEERDHFEEHWGVPSERVVYTPWQSHLLDDTAPGVPSDVFAGGDSLRDYRPLVEAARRLPDLRFRFATTTQLGPLPSNVEVTGSSRAEMLDGVHGAGVVVAPLAGGGIRASGQFTYLSAMAAGKLVVAPDVIGVRDYVVDGTNGLVVPPGDASALVTAIRWARDPANAGAVAAMRARARADVRDGLQPSHYVERLMALALRVAGRGTGRLSPRPISAVGDRAA